MTWPSAKADPIDTIPALNYKKLSISEQIAERMEKDEFRVTQGSILAQIYMDRCLQSLFQALPIELAGSLQMHPDELAQLEVNALDGFFQSLPEIVTEDLAELRTHDQATIALGTFIGEALTRALSAIWDYHPDPIQATLRLGKARLEPMKIAHEWIKSPSREDVDLRQIVHAARRALPATRFVPTVYEHLDPTQDLQEQALITKLAELWSFYRFKLVRVPGAELVSDLKVIWQTPEIVLFSLHERWCPELPEPSKTRGRSRDRKYTLAHVRRTGEFLLMSYRTHLRRALPLLGVTHDQEGIKRLMSTLAEAYCPGGVILRSDEQARQVAQSTALNALHGPQIQLSDQYLAVTFWEITQGKAQRWTIAHASGAWSFELAR